MSNLMMAIAESGLPYQRYREAAERSAGLRVRSLDQFLPVVIRPLADGLHRATAAMRAARNRRQLLSDLGRMDARLLADIGLRQGQVQAVADGLLTAKAATTNDEPA